MAYVLQIVGFANGTPCPHAGQFVEWFDHEAGGGQGAGEFTRDPCRAMQFLTAGEAFVFWRRISVSMPTRYDGKPNRPMTCATVEIRNLFDVVNHDKTKTPTRAQSHPRS